ncbi:MAG TPA: hypothetical protein VF458_21785 [Ktedonobacteraceae bacterium]
MTQTRGRETSASVLDRAEQTLTRAGKQLGHLAGRTGVRFWQATRALRAEADQMDEPDSTSEQSRVSSAQSSHTNRHALERAEEIVNQMGERVTRATLGGNLSIQRAVARLREDVEDMWVEARETRQEWRDKREHPGGTD